MSEVFTTCNGSLEASEAWANYFVTNWLARVMKRPT